MEPLSLQTLIVASIHPAHSSDSQVPSEVLHPLSYHELHATFAVPHHVLRPEKGMVVS